MVISPNKLKKIKDSTIIITSMYYKEIIKQLSEMKIDKYTLDSVAQNWMNHYLPQGGFHLIEAYKPEAKKS
ncbi:hypothetical protein CLPUN_21200 [Clostridium puniceum]|uniref:Uncharacterized protein n=1 Tax=Clostridium puniceum TaxID=29367 RepID=A0A1S8TJI1_9CLOT|nr:hypothetical protein [Clostridium puniceum]OOM77947.1 hypothetical protein CLPUN_21200 [Clostridium puniceum]